MRRWLMLLLLVVAGNAHAAANGRQEIVFLMIDDVSPQSYGAYGDDADTEGPYTTPNFDAMATNGQLYLNAHSQAMCSPTRRSIMYGNNPLQHGVGQALGQFDKSQISRLNLASSMQALGWRVVHLGKAHMHQQVREGEVPGITTEIGAMRYDEAYCYRGRGNYPSGTTGIPGVNGQHQWYWADIDMDAGTAVLNENYHTDCVVDAIAALLADGTDPSPLLIMGWYNAAHSPNNPPPGNVGVCATEKYDKSQDCYPPAVEYVDSTLTTITAELDLVNEDLLIFIGDNGRAGANAGGTDFCPLGTGKGNATACGTRMAMAIQGKGVTAYTTNGGVPAIVNVSDFHDTLLEYAAGSGYPRYAQDSESFFDCFANPSTCAGRTVGYAIHWQPDSSVPIPMYNGESFSEYEIHMTTAENGTLYGLDREYDADSDPEDLGSGITDVLLDLGSATIIEPTERWGQTTTADAGDAATAYTRMKAMIVTLEATKWNGPPNSMFGVEMFGAEAN